MVVDWVKTCLINICLSFYTLLTINKQASINIPIIHSPIDKRVWVLRPKTGDAAKRDIPPYNKKSSDQFIN